MQRAQNKDTHALKKPRLSQNISLFAPVLYWLSHLTCISSLKAKNERKTLIYTQLKISRYSQHFSLFLNEFLFIGLRPIYCSLTCSSQQNSDKVFEYTRILRPWRSHATSPITRLVVCFDLVSVTNVSQCFYWLPSL